MRRPCRPGAAQLPGGQEGPWRGCGGLPGWRSGCRRVAEDGAAGGCHSTSQVLVCNFGKGRTTHSTSQPRQGQLPTGNSQPIHWNLASHARHLCANLLRRAFRDRHVRRKRPSLPRLPPERQLRHGIGGLGGLCQAARSDLAAQSSCCPTTRCTYTVRNSACLQLATSRSELREQRGSGLALRGGARPREPQPSHHEGRPPSSSRRSRVWGRPALAPGLTPGGRGRGCGRAKQGKHVLQKSQCRMAFAGSGICAADMPAKGSKGVTFRESSL